jgi:hypothetical protein
VDHFFQKQNKKHRTRSDCRLLSAPFSAMRSFTAACEERSEPSIGQQGAGTVTKKLLQKKMLVLSTFKGEKQNPNTLESS